MTERTIFLAALACDDPARRAAYLDGACGDDPVLRRRVEALLQAHGGGSSAGGAGEMTRGPDETPGGEPIGLGFLEPSDDPASLGRLGHYDVRQVLGRGGFGVVLQAFDQKLHRPVAIKVLAPYLAASGTARQRFLREARAAAAVRHEHVVDIHAVEDEPVPYLVMEYVAGETLQKKLDRDGPLPAAEVLRVGAQAARGLAAAHLQGLVHRDVKPANILLEAQGLQPLGLRVKITDFGLARAADDARLTQSGAVAGTPQYMAPEQAEAEAVDHRADLFSLGSTLYAACTGEPPFRAGTPLGVLKRVSEQEPRPIRDANPAIPARLCEIIARLLAKRPEDRFPSADEVAEVLEQYLAEIEAGAAAAPEVPPVVEEEPEPAAGGSRRRSRWIIVATALAALVAAVALAEAAGVVRVGRTVARLFASAPPVAANDERPADLPPAIAPPQAAPDRPAPRPANNAAPVEPPPLEPLPAPVVEFQGRKVIDLPEPFEEVRAGAAGRLLIFRAKNAKKLTVVDVCKGQIVGEIPLSEDVCFAAGREKLLVVFKGQSLVQRWDLRTLLQDKGKLVRLPAQQQARVAVMGCDSAGPLALWTGDRVTLLDIERMEPLPISWPEPPPLPQEGFDLRASADGRTLVGWVTEIGPSPIYLLRPVERKTVQVTGKDGINYADRWAMPGADGSLVFRSDHLATDASLKPY
ncbi:MAG TPA: serine/threonine-protein kinase, partial [Gemmataceae bacterium]|nr:serine/threonine-protein kinase [Gemmataceae bacterium]